MMLTLSDLDPQQLFSDSPRESCQLTEAREAVEVLCHLDTRKMGPQELLQVVEEHLAEAVRAENEFLTAMLASLTTEFLAGASKLH